MAKAADGPLAGRSAWVLTEGHAGMEIQALALAEALGLDPAVKRIKAPPWAFLPPGLWPTPLAAANAGGAALSPPWPDILITCGRRSVAAALALRRASRRDRQPGAARPEGRGTFTIHIQDPKVDPARFDAVIAPLHDRVPGRNVIGCLGSIHGFTPETLADEAARSKTRFADLPRPLIGVLIGGPTRAYPMRLSELRALGRQLARLADDRGYGLAVVPSRRTGAARVAVLREALAGTDAFLWDGAEPNPYRPLLAAADALVVTSDSVNMTCEAAAGGKPVYVAMLDGRSARFDAFHDAMRSRGHVRPFDGDIDLSWRPELLQETPRVAALIARRYLAQV